MADSVMGPAQAAVATYTSQKRGMRPRTVVESGYLDTREPNAGDRVEHTQDSEALIAVPSPPTIVRAYLINDFSRSAYCGSAECDPDRLRADIEPLMPGWAQSARPPAAAAGKSLARLFGMLNTRNRAVKHLGKLRKAGDGRGLPVTDDGDITDIFADTGDGEVYLGCRKAGPHGVFVRYTALMAQHYYDLGLYAAQVCPGMTDLWVFDFNRG